VSEKEPTYVVEEILDSFPGRNNEIIFMVKYADFEEPETNTYKYLSKCLLSVHAFHLKQPDKPLGRFRQAIDRLVAQSKTVALSNDVNSRVSDCPGPVAIAVAPSPPLIARPEFVPGDLPRARHGVPVPPTPPAAPPVVDLDAAFTGSPCPLEAHVADFLAIDRDLTEEDPHFDCWECFATSSHLQL
jgi:hypothetical protein